MKYQKLVRDHIPAIIEQHQKNCEYRILNDDEYPKKLNEKLLEECQEWIESETPEELADILEVLQAIAKFKGIQWDTIEELRKDKKIKNGGFDQKILLIEVTPKSSIIDTENKPNKI
jgi:predicted house-cleaning noncanonical NTP pyrophosphatase (MazG superfamily)